MLDEILEVADDHRRLAKDHIGREGVALGELLDELGGLRNHGESSENFDPRHVTRRTCPVQYRILARGRRRLTILEGWYENRHFGLRR